MQEILDSLISGLFSPLIESRYQMDSREVQFCPMPSGMHLELVDGLKKMGIDSLYSHQAEAWESMNDGRNVLIRTGTSSGKSLCYQLPVAQTNLIDSATCALFIFPTKALAEDQLKKMSGLYSNVDSLKPLAGNILKYDGDTKNYTRTAIRKKARLLFTNPDMLHLSILPHHTNWSPFFENLKYIIIDEVHTYRGVFGSHFANLLRRLKRITSLYGSSPQFILTSATISNARSFCETLIEKDIHEVVNDGSAQPKRNFFFINPPIIEADLGLRKGMIDQCAELVRDWISHETQIILFARSRKSVELALRRLRDIPFGADLNLQGYRSGYLPAERRAIETGLRDGEIQAVVATNALELGIDMGKVDIVLLMGYPGTVASFFQQSGRSGRRNQPSIAVMVASASPLDQFVVKNSEFIFEKNYEQAFLDPDNPLLLINHLQCAAFELPLRQGEPFGALEWPTIEPFIKVLVATGRLKEQNDRFICAAQDYPAAGISLRNIGESPIHLVLGNHNGKSIGEVDFNSAFRFVHPGAVYLHNGAAYRVTSLDMQTRKAMLEDFDDYYYTEPQIETRFTYGEIDLQRLVGNCEAYFSGLEVAERVKGFKRFIWDTHQLIDMQDLDLPETLLHTKGFRLHIPAATVEELRNEGQWANDPNQYGKDWPRIRRQVLIRDQHQCQICGSQYSGSNMHVHHKIPFRHFADTAFANRMENLVTLCSKCHSLAEQNLRLRSGLSGLAYLFANLTPCFVMCDIHDIGYNSDVVGSTDGSGADLVVYDQYPGGIGLSARIFQQVESILKRCDWVISTCPCKFGCPACVGPAGENGISGKTLTKVLIDKVIKGIYSNG